MNNSTHTEISKILITAAGGKVGQHVVTQLAQRKVSASAGFHTQAKATALRAPGIEGVVLDFESPESLAAAFQGIETLFLVTPGSPDQGRHEENILAEAKRVGVKRIVKLSGKIADHHTFGFSKWNRDAERKIKESGIPYTILRGNYFMQNFFMNAEQIKQGAFSNGPAGKRIALLDARDIAATAVAALTEEGHAGNTYDLNGPELLDGYAQAAVMSSVLGRSVKCLDVSAADFIEKMKSLRLPTWMVEAFGVAISDPEIPGDQSSAEIERILHRKPGTLEQFMKDYRFPNKSRGEPCMNKAIAAGSIKWRMPLISRLLYMLCAIGLPVGAHVADMSPSHIFNDRWPPHAKFHTGQTLSMSMLLSLFVIFFAWRKTTDQRAAVFATAGFAAAYWITQATAILYPNTAFFDPEFITAHSFVLGLPTQAYFQIIFLLLIALASWLALRYRPSCRLEALQQTGKDFLSAVRPAPNQRYSLQCRRQQREATTR